MIAVDFFHRKNRYWSKHLFQWSGCLEFQVVLEFLVIRNRDDPVIMKLMKLYGFIFCWWIVWKFCRWLVIILQYCQFGYCTKRFRYSRIWSHTCEHVYSISFGSWPRPLTLSHRYGCDSGTHYQHHHADSRTLVSLQMCDLDWLHISFVHGVFCRFVVLLLHFSAEVVFMIWIWFEWFH